MGKPAYTPICLQQQVSAQKLAQSEFWKNIDIVYGQGVARGLSVLCHPLAQSDGTTRHSAPAATASVTNTYVQ